MLRRARLDDAVANIWIRAIGVLIGLVTLWVAYTADLAAGGDPSSAQRLAFYTLFVMGCLITLVYAIRTLGSFGAIVGYGISRLIRRG